MKPKEFVVATRPINGIVENSIGIINSICPEGVLVYFVGKNEVVRASFDTISVIDVDKTGKGYPHKICNICHVLKPMEMFDKNQTDVKQKSTTRPSCKICRRGIDGVRLTGTERQKMDMRRPPDKTVFVCPICEKRTIVGITVRVVPDHDHKTGIGRTWICDSCNTGLGRFKDDIVFFDRIIAYLKRFDTDI
jgi:hypothetical protein